MKILIVDDDPLSLEIMSRALASQAGYEVEIASSGLEALCRVLIGDIDLVITDWLMPGMDGPTLCRGIREAGLERYVYVVLVTGNGSASEAAYGLDAGADEFLAKPVAHSELIARVRSIQRMKGLRDELESRNREREEMQQFRNEWVDTVVRNIRSRMSAILGLRSGVEADATPELRRYLHHVRYEVGWLDRMLQQMLVVARSGDGRLKPFRSRTDLLDVATAACQSLSALARSKKVRLVVFSPEGDFRADCDGALMRGVFDNLLANAIRHSPPGSSVVVELRREGERVHLAVIDEGPGLPEEAMQALFDSGAGEHASSLGLAYCHAVATAHDGEIVCRPNRPTGSRFELDIPVSAPDAQAGLFDPVAFAATLPWDAILPMAIAQMSDSAAIEAAVDSRLVLFPSDPSLPC